MLAYKVREQQIQVSLELAAELPQAAGDELQVQQVVINLLRNAIEAIGASRPPQCLIQITTRAGGDKVEIIVEDSGAGLQLGQPDASLKRSTPPGPRAWGSAFLSAEPLSKLTAVACGRMWNALRGTDSGLPYQCGTMNFPPSPPPEPTIFVVDDDPQRPPGDVLLLECNAWRVEGFPSADEFLKAWSPDRPGCLLLDVRMPGMSGLELQAALTRNGSCFPIIMMSGYGDVATCAQAFRGGAVDFLEKPADQKVLLNRILEAVERDGKRRQAEAFNPQFFARLRSLTPREREVMDRLMEGSRSSRLPWSSTSACRPLPSIA